MLRSADSKKANCEIIFEEFHDNATGGWRNRHTDGQTTYDGNTALCVASRDKNGMTDWFVGDMPLRKAELIRFRVCLFNCLFE